MSGPWEKYQDEAGPWEQYGKLPTTGGQRAIDIASKAAGGLKTGSDWLATRTMNVGADVGNLAMQQTPYGIAQRVMGPDSPEWLQVLAQPGTKGRELARRAGVPETNLPGKVGKIVDTAAEGVIGSLALPGASMFGTLLPAAVGAGASEAAGQLTEGQWYEPLARLGAGFGAGYAAGLPGQMMRNPNKLVRDATEGMSPADWQAAAARQAEAQRMGVPLMASEAIPRRPDSMHPINQLANDAMATTAGGKIMRPFMVDRLDPMKAAIGRHADPVAQSPGSPTAVDIALAQAADKAVRAPLNDRSAAAKVFFKQAAGDPIDAGVKADALSKIAAATQGAAPGGPVAAQLAKLKTQMEGSTTVGQMDEVYKNFKAIANAKAFEGEVVPDTIRTALKPILKDMRSGLSQTNPSYATGMSKYDPANPLTQEVEAAARSGVGQVAGAYQGKPDAARGLFSKWILDPDNARPATVKADIARLKAQDPRAANDALRLFIDNTADQSFKQLQGGPNVAAGSKFAQTIGGTDIQRANLTAAIEAASGKTTAVGFEKLLGYLDRTGQTGAIGSQTQPRQMRAEIASQGPLTPVFEAANMARGSVAGTAGRAYRNIMHGSTYAEIARLAVDPDGVKKLHALALLNPQSAKFRNLANATLQGALGMEEATP